MSFKDFSTAQSAPKKAGTNDNATNAPKTNQPAKKSDPALNEVGPPAPAK